MQINQADTVIISDIHLGSPLSRNQLLRDVLLTWKFKRLIILGDLFACNNLKKLKYNEQIFLKLLSDYNQSGIEVVWVEGNHDSGIISSMKYLLGIKVHDVYTWQWNGKECSAIHGHQFDKLIYGVISTFISWIYLKLLDINLIRIYIGENISKFSTHLQNIAADVRNESIKMAKRNNVDYIFAGHTHHYEQKNDEDITYINTGSWVDKQCILIALHDDKIKVYKYGEK